MKHFIIPNEKGIGDACVITTDCQENIVAGLKVIFREWGEVNIAKGVRALASITDFTEKQIINAIKRRGVDKAYFEEEFMKAVNDLGNRNDPNRLGEPIQIIGKFRIIFDAETKANKRIIRAIMHNRTFTRSDWVSTFGGRSNNYSTLHKTICECFGVKHVKYISDDVMQSEAMQQWLKDNPCPEIKQTKDAWNGLTDNTLVDRLKDVYGPNTKLPGLATELFRSNGKSYNPRRYRLNVNEAGLAMIREYYMGLRRHPTKGWRFHTVLTCGRPTMEPTLWNDKSDFLGWIIKHDLTMQHLGKRASVKGVKDDTVVNVIEDFAHIYNAGLHTDEGIMRRYREKGIKPPRLYSEKYNIWKFSHPRNLKEFAGVLNDDVHLDNRYLDTKGMSKIGPNGDWLSRLFMFAKMLDGFSNPSDPSNSGIGVWEMTEGFIKYAPSEIKSFARNMIRDFHKTKKHWNRR